VAGGRDTSALRALLALAPAAESSLAYPALSAALLARFGDRAFAAQLTHEPIPTRRAVVRAIDRALGSEWSAQAPATWRLAEHDSTLLPLAAPDSAANLRQPPSPSTFR
jgi:hypothetical protein